MAARFMPCAALPKRRSTRNRVGGARRPAKMELELNPDLAVAEAESILAELAGVFFQTALDGRSSVQPARMPPPSLEERYRVLLDQMPAVVFMAYLDEGIGEAYVS